VKPYVLIPSGKCPVTLESTDDEAILKWARDLRNARSDARLSNQALRYWVQYSFPIFSKEWKHVRDRIDSIVKDVKRPRHHVGQESS